MISGHTLAKKKTVASVISVSVCELHECIGTSSSTSDFIHTIPGNVMLGGEGNFGVWHMQTYSQALI